MRQSINLAFILTSALLGCSRSAPSDFAPREEGGAIPALGAVAAAKPTRPLATAGEKAKKAAKAQKPKDESHLPAGWCADYAQALARAKSTGQPLLVLFH
jgi:hypothetical protein